MKMSGQQCGEIWVTGLLQTESVLRQLNAEPCAEEPGMQPTGAEGQLLSWKAEQGVRKGC